MSRLGLARVLHAAGVAFSHVSSRRREPLSVSPPSSLRSLAPRLRRYGANGPLNYFGGIRTWKRVAREPSNVRYRHPLGLCPPLLLRCVTGECIRGTRIPLSLSGAVCYILPGCRLPLAGAHASFAFLGESSAYACLGRACTPIC